MRAFASDNYAPALPEALEAIAAANQGHAVSYGAPPVTARLSERVREHFGAGAVGFPVFNGTGANVVGLRAMLRPWQGVICAESAHLNTNEGGAPEAQGAIKLLTVPTLDGKLTSELVERHLVGIGDEHVVQPGVVSITQATELGTLYSVVFAVLPREATAALQRDFRFYVWDEHTGAVRWMCAWDTAEADVDAFAAAIASVASG